MRWYNSRRWKLLFGGCRKRYAKVSPGAFGLNKGKKRIAVIRAGGAIVGGGGGGGGGQIKADAVIRQLRRVEKDKVCPGAALIVHCLAYIRNLTPCEVLPRLLPVPGMSSILLAEGGANQQSSPGCALGLLELLQLLELALQLAVDSTALVTLLPIHLTGRGGGGAVSCLRVLTASSCYASVAAVALRVF